MFGFLKKKLKETVDKFTKKAEEDAEITEEIIEEKVDEPVQEIEEKVVEELVVKKKTVKESKKIKSISVDAPSKEPVSTPTEDLPSPFILPEKVEDVIEPEEPELFDAPQEIIQEEVKDDIPLPKEEVKKIKKSIDDPHPRKKEASVPVISETAQVQEVEAVDEDIVELIDSIPESNDSEEKTEKKGFFKSLFSKKEKEEVIEDAPEELIEEELEEDLDLTKEELPEVIEDVVEEYENEKLTSESTPAIKSHSKEAVHKDLLEEDVKDSTKKKKGFFKKIKERVVKFQLTDETFEDIFWDFELALLENNVAMEVIEKIKTDLHEKLTEENVSRGGIEEVMIETLKNSISEVLDCPSVDLIEKIKNRSHSADHQSPFVICVVGVNGSGKTTTIGKVIKYFQNNDLSIVVAAADTFRAAAIQQLQEHTDRLGVKLIKHDYNSDPAAVAFDAIKHASAKNIDVVLIDTAGRLQSNSNLMDELRKLVRVNKPDFNLFIGESITGNDCVEQAVAFNDAVGIDGIVLSKADIDEKGGAALSVSYVTKKPILFLGTGQTYDDLKSFDKAEVMANLGL